MKATLFHIREAIPQDAPQIASVHIKTWQQAYRHIFPADKLASLDQDHPTRTERWQANIKNPDHLPAFLVAENPDGEIVGIAAAGKQLKEAYPYDAELFLIYILPDYQGKGIGRGLLSATSRKLLQLGFTSLILWVLAENTPGRRFYEKSGGTLVGEDEYLRWDRIHQLVAYGWNSLDTVLDHL
jgi:GNAT superfamily N-acetyltransferase